LSGSDQVTAADLGAAVDAELDREGRGDWRRAAACRGATALFFPSLQIDEGGERRGTVAVAQAVNAAKAICYSCASLAPCFRFSIAVHSDYGVWSGLTVRERQEVRKAMAMSSEQARTRYGGVRTDDERIDEDEAAA
jgi:WhiB family redox-sensing transcriptional regulator